jgi:hypothetical protein
VSYVFVDPVPSEHLQIYLKIQGHSRELVVVRSPIDHLGSQLFILVIELTASRLPRTDLNYKAFIVNKLF